jgi:phage shock protein C
MRRIFDKERRGPYRSRKGMILGVCRGLAEHLDFSVGGVRLIVIGLGIFTGFWLVTGLYILAAILMKPEPVIPFESDADEEFYDSYVNSRSMALGRLKRKSEDINERIQRMEDVVTSRERDWERRFNGSDDPPGT